MNKLGFIKKQLVKLYGKEKTDVIVDLAQKHYQECTVLCKDASKGERTHLEDTILPTSFRYSSLLLPLTNAVLRPAVTAEYQAPLKYRIYNFFTCYFCQAVLRQKRPEIRHFFQAA